MAFDATTWMTPSGGGYEIDNSVKLNDDDSSYLNKTYGSAGNQKTWTWSGWVKRATGTRGGLFGSNTGSGGVGFGFGDVGGTNWQMFYLTAHSVGTQITTRLFRDFSAWYHIVVAFDSTQGTAANRVKLYVNGTQVTFASSIIVENNDYHVNSTNAHFLGNLQNDALFDGYMAEVNFLDGITKAPADFGETGDYGEWKPIKYSG